ncbi:MAG: hypothetical protein J0L52_05410 [Caulobacterales bacterium]|nr:hypothetical protein [Caulobacterales bacterium]
MKTILAVAALTALIPAAAAQAQEVRREERVVVLAGPGSPMEIGDEGLTREAFAARHMAMFERLDADHDGVVTRDEMEAMAQAHGAGGHGLRFHGVDGEEIQLDGDGEWTSEDGLRRIVIRRHGPGAEGAPMIIDGETIDIEGGEGGERRIVIRRRGPDGETVDVHEGPGEWSGADGERRIIIGGLGPEGGERHVMVFRHEGEGGLDADGDGRWTFEEMAAPIREHFNQLDANHDGFVDAAEREH